MGLPIKDGKITTPYKKLGKMWSKGYHTGIDMAVKTGTPVIAVAPLPYPQQRLDNPDRP